MAMASAAYKLAPQLTTIYEEITPRIAKEYLKLKFMNRTLRQQVIEEYVNAMSLGLWKTTHEGIAFDSMPWEVTTIVKAGPPSIGPAVCHTARHGNSLNRRR